MNSKPRKVTLLCKIVDNLGDAGVCWRLARQLTHEYGCAVTLWVDQPAIMAKMNHGNAEGVTIRAWPTPFPQLDDPGDVVIEAFACGTPPALIDAMRHTRPVWINLEYLSAEAWVEDSHRLTSVHPATGLVQHFFFPGFTPRTGGLLRELDPAPHAEPLFARLGVPARDELRVSLFAYPHAPKDDLLAALRTRPSRLFIPTDGPARQTQDGALVVHEYPFLTQGDFDLLLAGCDLNFVRGEDSLVRAIWAKKPFIWQIYRQEEGAHQPKLKAFLKLISPFLGANEADLLALGTEVWNLSARGSPEVWTALFNSLPALQSGLASWSETQARQKDLASQLIALIEEQG